MVMVAMMVNMARRRAVMVMALMVHMLILATAAVDFSLHACDRNGTGPPSVTAKELTTVAGKPLDIHLRKTDNQAFPIMHATHGRAYLSVATRTYEGYITTADCDTDGTGCVVQTASLAGIEVLKVLENTASCKGYLLLEVQYKNLSVPWVPGSEPTNVVRCSRANLTNCHLLEFRTALPNDDKIQQVSSRLLLVANDRVFVQLKIETASSTTSYAIASCALKSNLHNNLITDCRMIHVPANVNYDSQTLVFMAANAKRLFATLVRYNGNTTVTRCPFSVLSLAAPSCQVATLPISNADGPIWSLQQGAVYKGRLLLTVPTRKSIKVNGMYTFVDSVEIVVCGGDALVCTRHDGEAIFGPYRVGHALHDGQLSATAMGVFIWPTSQSKLVITECRLPAKRPLSWFQPNTCRRFDIGTLANIAQDLYNLPGSWLYESRLFYDSTRKKLIAAVNMGPYPGRVYMLGTGLPCATLTRGCGPVSCKSLNYSCGTGLDGCGGAINCGGCIQPTPFSNEVCYGGGVPNQCGCTPQTYHETCEQRCSGAECAGPGPLAPVIRDGCGRQCDCGTCHCGNNKNRTCGRDFTCVTLCDPNAPQFNRPGSCNHDGVCRLDPESGLHFCDITCDESDDNADANCSWLAPKSEVKCCDDDPYNAYIGIATCRLIGDCPTFSFYPPDYYR